MNQIVLNHILYVACTQGNQARIPFNRFKETNYIKTPLFNIHTDIRGPVTLSTIIFDNYLLTHFFQRNTTLYCVTYLLSYK